MKICRSRPPFFCPDTPYPPPLQKTQKQSKIAFLIIYCILSLLVQRIFGIEFNFQVTHTTTMVSQYQKKPTFFVRKPRFLGHPRFFEVHGLYGLLQAKKWLCQISKSRANCDVGVDLFWNVGVKIRRNRPTCCCCLVRTPHTDPFLARKCAKPAFEGT